MVEGNGKGLLITLNENGAGRKSKCRLDDSVLVAYGARSGLMNRAQCGLCSLVALRTLGLSYNSSLNLLSTRLETT